MHVQTQCLGLDVLLSDYNFGQMMLGWACCRFFVFLRRKFKGKESWEFSCHVGKYKWCWGDFSCREIRPGRLTSVWVWVQGWQHKGRDEKDLFSCICGDEEAVPPKYCSLRQTRESSWHPHKNDVGASASFLWCRTGDITLELILLLWWLLFMP